MSRVGAALLALALLFVPTLVASAAPLAQVPPLSSLSGPVEDQSGVITADRAELDAALAQFHEATGYSFHVVTVDAFDAGDQEWADTTATNAGLGSRDILLAVSTGANQRYAISIEDGALNLTPAQENALVGTIEGSLTAASNGSTTWGAGLANIVRHFQNEIAADPATGAGQQPATGIDGPEGQGAPNAPSAPSSGGLPTWATVLLWILVPLAILGAIIYGWGGYKRKRLEAQRQNNPLGL